MTPDRGPNNESLTTDALLLREAFEKQAKCSYGFKRSVRGTYQNPATARDWKWFQAGASFAKTAEVLK